MTNKLWQRHRVSISGTVIALASALLFLLFGFLTKNGDLTNVGFLVLGAAIAALALFLTEWEKRGALVHDLSRALHEELAALVARCCIDSEQPWRDCLYAGHNEMMDRFRALKFVPQRPEIYLASADHLSVLEPAVLQKLRIFYYRLAAWDRDLRADPRS